MNPSTYSTDSMTDAADNQRKSQQAQQQQQQPRPSVESPQRKPLAGIQALYCTAGAGQWKLKLLFCAVLFCRPDARCACSSTRNAHVHRQQHSVRDRHQVSPSQYSGSRCLWGCHVRFWSLRYLTRCIAEAPWDAIALSSAIDKTSGRKVAIKKIPRAFQDLVDAKRILREVKMLRHLQHENVCDAWCTPSPLRSRPCVTMHTVDVADHRPTGHGGSGFA